MKRILIVDDEPDVLKILGKRLEKTGYEIIEARNGKEAIEKAKKERPDLVLLDLMMPDLDGGEVAQILSEDETTKNIPIIYLTCLYTKREERKEGHFVGQNILVAKPYNTEELLKIIQEAIK